MVFLFDEVPMIVAVNKCDKPGVDTAKVLEELMQHNVMVEEFGGEVPAVKISGKTGMGLAELEETILTIAEVVDYRGDPDGPVEGTIIESKMSKELGNVATVLVKRGTLKPGSIIVAGNCWCKVKRMISDNGDIVSNAGPSYPVEVLGWKELPEAGDMVLQAASESIAKQVSKNRKRKEELLLAVKDIDALNEKRAVKDTEDTELESKSKEYRVIVKGTILINHSRCQWISGSR
jgi:translation initiation factor IF-2